jgi:hypothetical protein
VEAIKNIFKRFIDKHFPQEDRREKTYKSKIRTYLQRSLSTTKDPFAYFYLLAKIHKTPWVTRPIVSYSGSILHGLGRWVDGELQRICQHLPYALRSSTDLVKTVRSLENLPPNALLFTCDAQSMYTNINKVHALTEISAFLRASPIPLQENVNVDALIEGLRIIMNHNLFRFGDTFWAQQDGTAMGTPPAPMYATLYFAIHEERIIPLFVVELQLYRRFIDDGAGLWLSDPDPAVDNARWSAFQTAFSSYGKLKWDFSPRARSVDFLDLTITITNGRIETCLFEKALNLYLYLPPHSAHPPGVVKGLIHGMLLRINRLTTHETARTTYIRRFYQRLRVRGYSRDLLLPLFETALSAMTTVPQPKSDDNAAAPVYLHVPFHPSDPPSRDLQRIFRSTLLEPPKEPRLPLLKNRNGDSLGIERMVVAYHRPRNLGNILSPRRLTTAGDPVSSIFAKLQSG